MPKRRQERAVKLLRDFPESTAAAIAIGRISKVTCHPFLEELARREFVSDGLFAAKCNEYQINAIQNAFRWPISLIWGPPGTGKTITGTICRASEKSFWLL